MTGRVTLNGVRRTVRTVFAAFVGLASMAPLVYAAAAQRDPGEASGWAALALAIAGAVTRVMALPVVEAFLQRFLPFLAAKPDTEYGTVARRGLPNADGD